MKGKVWSLGGARRLLVGGLLGASLSIVAQGSLSTASADVFVDQRPAASWRVNGVVRATVIVGDTVVVGGSFTTAVSPNGQSVARRNLAAFSLTTGALRTDWRADASADVRALETDGSSIYVGGSFTTIAGQARQRIAKLGVATGAVDAQFRPNLNSTVRAIETDASAVYVGGQFTTVNGATRQRIAKLTFNGALDPDFRPNANGYVWGIVKTPTSSVVYVSGLFTQLNGVNRNGVGALSATNGSTTGPSFGSSARPTLGLAINPDGTRLYGAGANNTAAAWSTTTGTRVWRVVTMGDIQAIVYYQGTVYFGFHDGYQTDQGIKLLAADAVTGALDPDFRPRFNRFMGVMALDISPLGLVAGGDFTSVTGVAAQGWVRFPPEGPPDPGTEEVTFAATDDATIHQGQPTTNFGGADRLLVDSSPAVLNSLVRFSVTGVAGRQVQRATLRLYVLDPTEMGGAVSGTSDTTWSEQTVTWNTAPAAGPTVGTLPGVQAGSWYEVDVTDLVTGDGAVSLRITPMSTNGADYASSEYPGGLGPALVLRVEDQ
ncbi:MULTISPECIES: DNRLRE domain-containing protein [unclassified Nocardioides]|uniref:CBM96 family carbohydrate-binding protein n=1 Tax=unclassified Nocardioides TaxID=2615069 RepID=UPI0006FE28E9|nr:MULTISPECIES: DNRLRE domain-containing protein [unclassified Nocardioides]KQY55586.1 hypothetical protein ASD30_17015 [Nocardioides sp. Root140]KQZ67242.1 hypothetical protein ASD66_19940 [Nocardioides sp. Root151]